MTADTRSLNTPPEIAEHEPAIAPRRAKRLYLILGGAVVLLLILYAIYALLNSGKEATDDAQVSADVVPIAARVAGQVVSVSIHENEPVKAGQLLAELDPQDAQVKLAQANGDLATAQAQAADADARASVTEATARGALDAAKAAVQGSREGVDTSTAMIAEAQAGVSRASAIAKKARRMVGQEALRARRSGASRLNVVASELQGMLGQIFLIGRKRRELGPYLTWGVTGLIILLRLVCALEWCRIGLGGKMQQ